VLAGLHHRLQFSFTRGLRGRRRLTRGPVCQPGWCEPPGFQRVEACATGASELSHLVRGSPGGRHTSANEWDPRIPRGTGSRRLAQMITTATRSGATARRRRPPPAGRRQSLRKCSAIAVWTEAGTGRPSPARAALPVGNHSGAPSRRFAPFKKMRAFFGPIGGRPRYRRERRLCAAAVAMPADRRRGVAVPADRPSGATGRVRRLRSINRRGGDPSHDPVDAR
jgi:hypothetical protein